MVWLSSSCMRFHFTRLPTVEQERVFQAGIPAWDNLQGQRFPETLSQFQIGSIDPTEQLVFRQATVKTLVAKQSKH